MKEFIVTVAENRPIAQNVYSMRFLLPERAEGLACGKFVNISVGDGAHLLRRPIAICGYDENSVTICYQVKGAGTRELSRKKAGDVLSCVLPLGNGFVIEPQEKRIALIGGGVGVFPMLSVLRDHAGQDKAFCSYIGFRNKGAVCMQDEFAALSERAHIVTDDGSFGGRGNAVSAFFADIGNARPDVIFACGPVPMLRALKAELSARGLSVPCYVSLEERMGCGIGACLVCVCKRAGGKGNARVCKDGPVFAIGEVEI